MPRVGVPARGRGWSAWRFDAALALLVAALQVSSLWLVPAGRWPDFPGPDATAVALALTGSLPLVARRRLSGVVLAVVGLSAVAQAALGIPGSGFGLVVALYSVAAYAPRRESLIALAVFAVFTVVSLVLYDAVAYAGANAFVFLTAWVFGDQRRATRERMAALDERTAELERERADRARLAAAQERNRLAAELQDLVAHGVTAMLAQARGAERLLGRDQRRARAALEAVEATGRQSLDELRRLLSLLRGGGGDAELAPQPGIDDIAALVERFRAAGLDTTHTVAGPARPVPRAAGLAAYRMVQQALAAIPSAGGPPRVKVTLRFAGDCLAVEVLQAGAGPAGSVLDGAMDGARERVTLLGGELSSAPVGGAYRVSAQLPVGGVR